MAGVSRAPQARTRLARRAVLDAAGALFLERGYAGTTIEAISSASDVPLATVYRLFSSKDGILKALIDVTVAGDDDPVAVAERPDVRRLLNTADPRDRVAGLAAVSVDINTRAAPIYRILQSAAGSDNAAAAILDELTRQRQEGQARVAASLARSRALRPGLRAGDAADLIHALASPKLYRLLVVDRRWSGDRFEAWLAEALASQLLSGEPRGLSHLTEPNRRPEAGEAEPDRSRRASDLVTARPAGRAALCARAVACQRLVGGLAISLDS